MSKSITPTVNRLKLMYDKRLLSLGFIPWKYIPHRAFRPTVSMSHGGQPPLARESGQTEPAASRWLNALVRRSSVSNNRHADPVECNALFAATSHGRTPLESLSSDALTACSARFPPFARATAAHQ